jgi:hypothetical protein
MYLGASPQLTDLALFSAKRMGAGVLQDMAITRKLRLVFYLLATIELVLMSVVWGRLPL